MASSSVKSAPSISTDKYEVFKFFKNTYTKVNSASRVVINSNLEMELLGCSNSEYFLFVGKIIDRNLLTNWLEKHPGKSISIDVNLWNMLGKCLKRDAEDITFSDSGVVFQMANADNMPPYLISFKLEDNQRNEKKNKILSKLSTEKVNITDRLLHQDVLELYTTDQNTLLVDGKSENKLIEIPVARILSLQKDCDVYLRFSDDNTTPRYVAISTATNLIELEQVFATI